MVDVVMVSSKVDVDSLVHDLLPSEPPVDSVLMALSLERVAERRPEGVSVMLELVVVETWTRPLGESLPASVISVGCWECGREWERMKRKRKGEKKEKKKEEKKKKTNKCRE